MATQLITRNMLVDGQVNVGSAVKMYDSDTREIKVGVVTSINDRFVKIDWIDNTTTDHQISLFNLRAEDEMKRMIRLYLMKD